MTFQHRDMERSEAGGFRELSVDEIDAVAGGDSYDFMLLDANSDGAVTEMEVAAIHGAWTPFDFSEADADKDGVLSEAEMANLIVVTAPQWWYGLSSGLSGGYSGYSGGDAEEWYSGGGGGGNEGGGQECSGDVDGHAHSAATDLLSTLPPGTMGPHINSPANPNWTNAEFISFLGGSGQVGQTTIVLGGGANLGSLPGGGEIEGFIHNHPQFIYQSDGTYIELSDELKLENRYPSGADWNTLQAIADTYTGSEQYFNPSLYLVGPDGELREFKLSDRAFIESLSKTQMGNGVGLETREHELGSC